MKVYEEEVIKPKQVATKRKKKEKKANRKLDKF